MTPKYAVSIEQFKELNAMPAGWTEAQLRALLQALEFEDLASIADADLREYVVMALQDREASEAARIALAQTLGKLMNAGQIQNLAEEMKDDRKWEEASDMRCHEPIFNAQVLLHEAFPADYAAPDIVRVTARITPKNQVAETLLRPPIPEALLVRLLADGMPDSAVLKRLFRDALDKGPFPEASQIIWQFVAEPGKDSVRATVYTPHSWFGPLEDAGDYESEAFPDET